MALISLADIRDAHRVVSRIVIRTPILPLKFCDRPQTYVKCENLQRAGAFKIRGAYNKISRLPRSCRGVVAASSGNHAQAVALAAKLRGIPARIFMPSWSLLLKAKGARALGAKVIRGGRNSEVIRLRAERVVAQRGYTMIPSFNDPQIIAGQGTVGLEILQDLPEVQAVIVQIGGGGLASGIATALKNSKPRVKVFGVEPRGAPTMSRSLRKGKLVTMPKTDTIADGLKPVRVGELTFEHVRKYVDEVVLVSDAEILAATRHLILKEKLVVEPSGAATFAAVQSGKIKLPRGPVVVILSGGNADLKNIL